MSLTVLPVFAIPLVWNWLRQPPFVDPVTNAKTQSFVEYFDKVWLREFLPSLWSHFDNFGPRTTNIAEGWHKSLNSRFRMPHPSLRVFLDWLQKYEYEIQLRLLQLAAGRTPTHRATVYVRNDEALWSAKVAFGVAIGHVFMTVGRNVAVWNDFYACSITFLNRASYLLMQVTLR